MIRDRQFHALEEGDPATSNIRAAGLQPPTYMDRPNHSAPSSVDIKSLQKFRLMPSEEAHLEGEARRPSVAPMELLGSLATLVQGLDADIILYTRLFVSFYFIENRPGRGNSRSDARITVRRNPPCQGEGSQRILQKDSRNNRGGGIEKLLSQRILQRIPGIEKVLSQRILQKDSRNSHSGDIEKLLSQRILQKIHGTERLLSQRILQRIHGIAVAKSAK